MTKDIQEINEDLFRFVRQHSGMNPAALRLRYAGKIDNDFLDLALTQIEARKKSAKKLIRFFENPRFIVPTLLSAEQATHPIVSEVHTEMIPTGSRVLDMTSGLGIDTFSIARKSGIVTACDIDINKITASKHNAETLGLFNIDFKCCDAVEYLSSVQEHFDCIIVDPARRGDSNKRLYALEECSPDIVSAKRLLLNRCDTLLIKASPMLDISEALRLFPEASEIAAISLQGECKEVLIRIDNKPGATILRALAVQLDGKREEFSIVADKMRIPISHSCSADEIKGGDYLLDPDAALKKLGAWGAIEDSYNIRCIGRGTNLFVCTAVPQKGFPGRIMKIIETDTLNGIKRRFRNQRINVVAVNAGEKADALRKQLKLKDGGEKMLYCFRDANGKVIGAVCERIK